MKSIFDIPELLISKGLPFVIYCLPESNTCKLIFQKEKNVDKIELVDIDSSSGFIIADFNSAQSGIASIIVPDFVLLENENTERIINYLSVLPDIGDFCFSENICISKDKYLDTAEYLISKLKDGELQKVVLSRVVKKDLEKEIDLSKLIQLLKDEYKNAFVYLFHLPKVGTWCGASPETFFKTIDSSINIDALAATRLITGEIPKGVYITEQDISPKWTLKEKEEQYYVSLFIESLLSELQISNYEQSDPRTMVAGKLAHIQTKFSIPLFAVGSKTGKLIAGLHPTPAVCGLPKAEAFFLIQKAEQHKRRYYTGFLGPWKMKNETQLFVNLRCAELDANRLSIYVGGGLTASSSPEAEYQETVHKSKTLLSIVENL